MILKDGTEAQDPRLGRVKQVDWRSIDYPVSARFAAMAIDQPRSYTWRCDQWLDQGGEGSCVGHGLAHELAARPVPVAGTTEAWARDTYHAIQREDPWPGGAYPNASPVYEGTSVLSGVKLLQRLGYYTGYRWGLTMREAVTGIGRIGPAILGLDWYEGMFDPDAAGFLRPTGQLAGGHCLLAVGAKIVWTGTGRTWGDVNLDASYVLLHNSWGQGWGRNGRAKLSLTDFDRLLDDGGDACFPTRAPGLVLR